MAAAVVWAPENRAVLGDHVAERVGDGKRRDGGAVGEHGRGVTHSAASRSLAPEQLPDGRAGTGADRTALRDRGGRVVTRCVTVIRSRPATRCTLHEVVYDRRRHQRHHPHRRRSTEASFLEPPHDAVRRREPERAAAGEQHGGRPLGIRQQRESLDFARPGAAAADVDAAPRPRWRDHDRTPGAPVGSGPVSDPEAGGQWQRLGHGCHILHPRGVSRNDRPQIDEFRPHRVSIWQ